MFVTDSPQHAPRNSRYETLILSRSSTGSTPPVGPVQVQLDSVLDRQSTTEDQEYESVEDDGNDGAEQKLRNGSCE